MSSKPEPGDSLRLFLEYLKVKDSYTIEEQKRIEADFERNWKG